MKVLIFNTLYYPNQLGGAEKSVQLLAEGLLKAGHNVTVVSTSNKDYVDYVNGVKVYYVKTTNLYWVYGAKEEKSYKKPLWHLIDSYNPFNTKIEAIFDNELMHKIQKNIEFNKLLFIFAGNDSYDDIFYYKELKREIEKFPNKILLGKVLQTNMPSLYKAIDIVLVPSLFESASIVSLEAMAAKKIILASNVGGIPELVKDTERGFLFEKENIDDLKLKLLYILTNLKSKKLDKIRDAGYEFCIKNYNWSKIADRTIEIYKKTLK